MSADTATLGSIVKTVGLRGEIKLLPGPDFWTGALNAARLDLVSDSDLRRSVRVERYRAKGNTYIIKLSGIESIDAAQPLVGSRLDVATDSVPVEDSPPQTLPFQVMGAAVRLVDGSDAGTVVDMLLGPAQHCLVIERDGIRSVIPMVPELVLRIDLEAGLVVIDPPEGLFDFEW